MVKPGTITCFFWPQKQHVNTTCLVSRLMTTQLHGFKHIAALELSFLFLIHLRAFSIFLLYLVACIFVGKNATTLKLFYFFLTYPQPAFFGATKRKTKNFTPIWGINHWSVDSNVPCRGSVQLAAWVGRGYPTDCTLLRNTLFVTAPQVRYKLTNNRCLWTRPSSGVWHQRKQCRTNI